MDEYRSNPPQPSPHGGVDGLGYTGRPAGDDEPTAPGDDVAGLGFGGRAAPAEFDGDRFSDEPNAERHDEPDDEPDATPDEDAD